MDREVATGMASERGWLTHNLKVLSGVSLLQDAASELLYPILPIFLTVVLGAPVAVVGVVEGLAEGAASLTKLASGFFGDRFHRPAVDRCRLWAGRCGQAGDRAGGGLAARAGRAGPGPARQGSARRSPRRAVVEGVPRLRSAARSGSTGRPTPSVP